MTDQRRKFTGPYLVLGIVPSWPKELEQRADYEGPHSSLRNFKPVVVPLPPGALVDSGVAMTDPDEGEEEEDVQASHEFYLMPKPKRNEAKPDDARGRKFITMMCDVADFLDQPRTALEISGRLGISKPTVYEVMKELKMRGFPLVEAKRREGKSGPLARTFVLVPDKKPGKKR